MKKIILSIPLIACLSGCSVFMAANKSGVDPEQIINCSTRSCLIASGATPIRKISNNEESFKAQLPKGSTSRAVLNGTLDVFTLGLWEVAGTPIEGSIDNNKFFTFKVKYKSNGEDIESLVK
jgi:hypothetical protein